VPSPDSTPAPATPRRWSPAAVAPLVGAVAAAAYGVVALTAGSPADADQVDITCAVRADVPGAYRRTDDATCGELAGR